MTLEEEAIRLGNILVGDRVTRVVRHRSAELMIEFASGARLFIDANGGEIECSVTGGAEVR